MEGQKKSEGELPGGGAEPVLSPGSAFPGERERGSVVLPSSVHRLKLLKSIFLILHSEEVPTVIPGTPSADAEKMS